MRYRIEDDFIVDDDNRDLVDVIIIPEDEYDAIRSELARRVNGWDKLVAFVRSVAKYSCCCGRGNAGPQTRHEPCTFCRARVALKEAGCE